MAYPHQTWDGYKQTVPITDSIDLKEAMESAEDDTLFTLSPGEYWSGDWITVKQKNIQLWAEPNHQGQVVISAGFKVQGAAPLRFTHLDFRTQTDRSVCWNLGGQVFFHGCAGYYTVGTIPWDGQYFANEFGRIVVQPSSDRHSDWNSTNEKSIGRLAQGKDNAFFRMTSSPNGWCVRFFTGCDKFPAVYFAGSDGFLEDVGVFGPNGWQTALGQSNSAGIAVTRGGSVFYQHRFSPAEIRGFRYGILTQLGGQMVVRSISNGLLISDCHRAIERLAGGRVVQNRKQDVRYSRNKYNNPSDVSDVLWEGEL